MKDDDIAHLFSHAPEHNDADVFEARVIMRLRLKLWLRQGLVVLAGVVGGIYALAQFIRLPEGVVSTRPAEQAALVGIEVVDDWTRNGFDVLTHSAPYLSYMQTPGFFWLSFALCVGFLGLYFAWSQEETL